MAPAFLTLLGALDWKSLPFRGSDRIVQINAGFDLLPLLSNTSHFQAISAYQAGWVLVEGPGGTTSVLGAAVDPEIFKVLAIQALRGRIFSSGSPPTDTAGAVLSESLCRHLFRGTLPPVGTAFRAGGHPFEVLGVVPDHPVYPTSAKLWVLRSSGIRPDSAFLPQKVPHLGILGRLSEGTSTEAAAGALRVLAREIEKRQGISQGDLEVVPLAELLRRRSQGERAILQGSLAILLAFVLLSYASAVSNSLSGRERELAVRLALGASRTDLIRLLFLEILLLGLPGLVTGLPLSLLVLGSLRGFVPLPVAELVPPVLDLASLALAVVGWILLKLVSVLGVWLSVPGIGPGSVLIAVHSGMRRTLPQTRLRFGFMTVALGLVVTLGIVMAMFRQSIDNLQREPLGFEPRNTVSAVVHFERPPAPRDLPAFLAQIANRLKDVPGITAVSFSDFSPFSTSERYLEISTPGRPDLWLARYQGITGDFVRATGVRLVAGREIAPFEQESGTPVALLDEEGASTLFRGRSPLGKAVVLNGQVVEIVGILSSTKGSSLDELRRPQLYLPLLLQREESPSALFLIARFSGPVLERDVNSAVSTDGASIRQYRPVTESVEASVAVQRLARNLATLQWASALVLVALAMFGNLSWLLQLRSYEHAVRLALGDTLQGIAWRVLRSVISLVAMAALLGVGLFLPFGQALRTLLFNVSILSPPLLLEAVAWVLVAALTAAAAAMAVVLRRLSLDSLRNSIR